MNIVDPRPRKAVAPDTHAIELERLARQEASHPACDPLTVQTLVWVLRASNAVLNSQADELRPLGLSPSAFNVLMALHNTDGHVLEPCQLADRLLVSRPSITGLLDTLQHKGFVVRRPHNDDRRRVLVELTDAGMQLLRSHFNHHYSEQNKAFADLSDDDKASLVGLLRRIRGAVPAEMASPDAVAI